MNISLEAKPSSKVDISRLLQSLGSTNAIERDRARGSLVAVGQDAVVPLLRLLKSPVGLVRWEAAKALAAMKVETTANALADLMDDEQYDVRWVAAQALVGLGREGLRQTLITLLTKADSIWVRESAHHVVSHFANRMSGEYLQPLLRLFSGFEPAVTIPPAALTALNELQRQTKRRKL